MTERALRPDEVGYWSEIKLDIVREYAQAYSTIMSKQAFKGHVYIDAFAGAGLYLSKATGEMVLGSPLNALQIEPPFRELHFIDLNGSRTEDLRRLTEADPRVTVYDGDCNDILLRRIFPSCRYEDFRRALCLLDPYGLNVNWSVLATAGQMRSIEVFYNFMIMDANMNVFLRDPSAIAPDQAARMTAVWGDESWRLVAYRTEQDLFGERVEKATNDDIAEAFRQRLRTDAGFAFVPPPIPMRNSNGAIIYYLYFASPNKTGAKIVAQIFDKYRDREAR